MKKNGLILFAALVTFSLMAFGYVNWGNKKKAKIDLQYDIDSRFAANITKKELYKAKSVVDIVPKEAEWSKITFLNMTITALLKDGEIRVSGENGILNSDQIQLLRSLDYSVNFYLEGKGKRKGEGPEGLKGMDREEFNFAYYLTIISEKEAVYPKGKHVLLDYLKAYSRQYSVNITEDQLQSGRINFTVTKTGSVAKIALDASSGYPAFDEALLALVKNMPEKWYPAQNTLGENVEQELVFFFGRMGC